MTRDDEFALWRTLWLGRFANVEREKELLRARLAWTEECIQDHLKGRGSCEFAGLPDPASLGVRSRLGATCKLGECSCTIFCSHSCALEWNARVEYACLRNVVHKAECTDCGDPIGQTPWVPSGMLSRIRRRYWPADHRPPVNDPPSVQ